MPGISSRSNCLPASISARAMRIVVESDAFVSAVPCMIFSCPRRFAASAMFDPAA